MVRGRLTLSPPRSPVISSPPFPPIALQLLSQLFTGLCNGTITSSIAVGRILVAAAVLLIIQLCFAVDVCCFHPGDSSAWLTTEESNAVSPGKVVMDRDETVLMMQPPNPSFSPDIASGGAPKMGKGAVV